MIKAYNNLLSKVTKYNKMPTIHYMDNEASAAFRANLKTAFQLVPPHTHRRNAAEEAIKAFKQHFIAILSGTHKMFPLHLWCRLLQQTELTLNTLRMFRDNPTISTHEAIYGPFNFDATPLSILGCKALTHIKPHQRKTWAPHAIEGWYVGPALNHYRCYTVFIPQTQAERITDTVKFFHHNITMPTIEKTSAPTQLEAIDTLKQILISKQLTNTHGVQRVPASPPQKIVASSTPDFVASPTQTQPLPVISQDDVSQPTHRYPTRLQQRLSQHTITQSQSSHELNAVVDTTTGETLTYRKLIRHPQLCVQ